MINLLNNQLQSKISKKIYGYRFLFSYIFIGFFSIVIEIAIYNSLGAFAGDTFAKILGLISGVIIAFYLNVRFNFKVPKPKRNRAFFFFSLISLFSFFLNISFRNYLFGQDISYAYSRLIASGALFLVGYLLHRKFSFKEYKQVGVAIYAHGDEDIKGIYDKIGFIGDFIHIDIVDDTYNPNSPVPTAYRLEAVKAYWPNKEIHCHIMSKTPSVWLDTITPFVDTIIIHYEIDEDINEILKIIKNSGRKVGVCLLMETAIESILKIDSGFDEVMLLTISKPGMSGQKFELEALKRIDALNLLPGRDGFTVCVDGGVNESSIPLIHVEKVVSGSYVLSHENPMQAIMRLQTSSQYEDH